MKKKGVMSRKNLRDHERQHTYQSEKLGPFYLPAHAYGGLRSWSKFKKLPHPTLDFWHAYNPFEQGPQDPANPRPWR